MKKVNVSAAGVLVSAMALSGAAVASPNAGFSQQEFRTALIEQDRIFKRTASVSVVAGHAWIKNLSKY